MTLYVIYVTLYGNRIFKDDTRFNEVLRVRPSSETSSVLIRRGKETELVQVRIIRKVHDKT